MGLSRTKKIDVYDVKIGAVVIIRILARIVSLVLFYCSYCIRQKRLALAATGAIFTIDKNQNQNSLIDFIV